MAVNLRQLSDSREATEFRHVQLDVGDVELHAVVLGAGEPILFCHGFPDVWIGWRRQMQAVAAAGYRAIAVDMRGYGRSSGPDDPHAYTPIHAVSDLVGLLDALELQEAAIVGHDFGATAAWYAGLLRPDRFTSVFAISVPVTPPGAPSLFDIMKAEGKRNFYMFRQREPEADQRWADASSTYPAALYWTSASPPPAEWWDPFDADHPLHRPAPVARPYWANRADIDYAIAELERGGFRRPLHSYSALHWFAGLSKAFAGMTIDQPSFFLMGAADGLNHVREIREAELRRVAPGLKQFVMLPEIGHWPHHEAADRTNDLLVTFLNERYR